MSTDTTAKRRIITLTNHSPVTIREAEWPIIASAAGDSWLGGDHGRHHQAKLQGEIDEYTLIVRQHADGRALVYGVVDAALAAWGAPARGESWRGGELLDADSDRARAIRRVGEAGGLPDAIIRACIADLPAVEI
jgi:hypothetical protein